MAAGRDATASEVYRSQAAWDPRRPDTVVISCVDGRWRRHMQAFARDYLKAEEHVDFVAVPGGAEPLTLFDWVPKDFNFFRRRLEALVRSHGTARIVAIAHQECAWYREHRIGPFKLDLRERQVGDLRRAAARLRDLFPGVAVETYFARLAGTSPEAVVFERV